MLTFLVESPTVGPGSGSPLAIQFGAAAKRRVVHIGFVSMQEKNIGASSHHYSTGPLIRKLEIRLSLGFLSYDQHEACGYFLVIV